MERRTVQLKVAGQVIRLVTTATDVELAVCSQMLTDRLEGLGPRATSGGAQAFLLVAIALAQDLVEARGALQAARCDFQDSLRGLLSRVDEALGAGGSEPSD